LKTETKEQEQKRAERNAFVLQRMKNSNDGLAAYDPTSSWFQPRPIIKKDKDAIKRLYSEGQSK
jgi:hypothetical protein